MRTEPCCTKANRAPPLPGLPSQANGHSFGAFFPRTHSRSSGRADGSSSIHGGMKMPSSE